MASGAEVFVDNALVPNGADAPSRASVDDVRGNSSGGRQTVPSWSLGLVFVLTLVFTLLLIAVVLLVRRNMKLTRFHNAFARNSGKVVIGRARNTAVTLPPEELGRRYECKVTYAKRDVPDIKIENAVNLHTASNDTEELAAKISPIGKRVRSCEVVLSPVSGVYAHMDSANDFTFGNTPPTYRTRDENSLLYPMNNASASDDNFAAERSYFTPVLRTGNADCSSHEPSGRSFKGRFRKQLMSAISGIGISINSSHNSTVAASTGGSSRATKAGPDVLEVPERDLQLRIMETAVPTDANENTYLSFSSSLLNTPPARTGH